jgi:hypothetical protein
LPAGVFAGHGSSGLAVRKRQRFFALLRMTTFRKRSKAHRAVATPARKRQDTLHRGVATPARKRQDTPHRGVATPAKDVGARRARGRWPAEPRQLNLIRGKLHRRRTTTTGGHRPRHGRRIHGGW